MGRAQREDTGQHATRRSHELALISYSFKVLSIFFSGYSSRTIYIPEHIPAYFGIYGHRKPLKGPAELRNRKKIDKIDKIAPKTVGKWIANKEILYICASDSIRAVWKLDGSSKTKEILPRD